LGSCVDGRSKTGPRLPATATKCEHVFTRPYFSSPLDPAEAPRRRRQLGCRGAVGYPPRRDPGTSMSSAASPSFAPRPAEGLNYPNVMQMFLGRVRKTPELTALRFKRDGLWRPLTWRGWEQAAREL